MSVAHVPRNEIPKIKDTTHDRLAVWRVEGVLALEQASAVVCRDAGARHETRPRIIVHRCDCGVRGSDHERIVRLGRSRCGTGGQFPFL
jgi:hypothetical protein